MNFFTNPVSLQAAEPGSQLAIRCMIHAGSVLATALVVTWTLRRTSAALRHLILLTSQVAAVVIPIAALLIGQLCAALFWFNPLAWLALRRSAELAEHASDDLVLQQGIAAAEYADHLLSVVRHGCSRLSRHLALSMSTPSQLRRRIAALLDDSVNHQVRSQGKAMGFVAIGFVLTLPVTAVSQKTSQKTAETEAWQPDGDRQTNTVKSLEKAGSQRGTIHRIPDSAPIDWESRRVAGIRVIRGRAIDEQGQPATNVDVGFNWQAFHGELSPSSLVITDRLEQFELPFGRAAVLIAMDKTREKGGLTILQSPDDDEQHNAASQKANPNTAVDVEITLLPLVDIQGSYWTKDANRRPRSVWTTVQKLPEEADVISQRDESPFFSFRLPPGRYRLRGSARDFEDVDREFVVDPATGPIKLLDLPMPLSKRALLYGRPAPELHIIRGLGIDTTAKLSDYRGKWVVLEFWGVWCGPCIFHMGQVFRFSKQHAADRERFEIITVHHDIPEQKLGLDAALPQLVERWQSTKDLDQSEFPFPIVIDKTGQTVEAYGINGFPTSVFIDPEGRIAAVPGVWELSNILKGRAEKSPDLFQAAGPDAAEHPPAIKPSDESEGVVGQRCVAFNGHRDMVAAVGFLPDGKQFVTSASDNTLRFWNVETRDQARLIRCTPQGSSISSYGGIQLYVAQQGNLVGGNVYEVEDERIIHFPRLWKADSDYQQSISLSDAGLEFGRADVSADGERATAMKSSSFKRSNSKPSVRPVTTTSSSYSQPLRMPTAS